MATKKRPPRDPSLDELFSSGYTYGGSFDPEPELAPVEAAQQSRNGFAVANDTVIDFANAAAGGVGALGDFIAPGNRVSRYINQNIIEAGKASQSDLVRAEDARYQQELQAAQGFGEEALSTLKYAARNPVRSIATAAGSFVGPGAAVKGARGMAAMFSGADVAAARAALRAGERLSPEMRAALRTAEKTATRAGMAGGAAVGAGMAGGDAAGTAYELALKAGATEEQAIEAAHSASVLPAIVGGAGGLVGAEKLLAGGKGFAGGRIAQALKTGAVEAGQEGVEEGLTQYEGQRAAVPFDTSINPMKGVGAAVTMSAVLGGLTGGGVSALTYRKGPMARAVASGAGIQTAPVPDVEPPAIGTEPPIGTMAPIDPTATGSAGQGQGMPPTPAQEDPADVSPAPLLTDAEARPDAIRVAADRREFTGVPAAPTDEPSR